MLSICATKQANQRPIRAAHTLFNIAQCQQRFALKQRRRLRAIGHFARFRRLLQRHIVLFRIVGSATLHRQRSLPPQRSATAQAHTASISVRTPLASDAFCAMVLLLGSNSSALSLRCNSDDRRQTIAINVLHLFGTNPLALLCVAMTSTQISLGKVEKQFQKTSPWLC